MIFLSVIGCVASTVDEFSFKPESYLHFLENNLKNYWRYDNEEKNKKTDPQLSLITDEFHKQLGICLELLKISGLHDIEEINGKSEKIGNGEEIHFKNKITIEFDSASQGFLKALFAELPQAKKIEVSEEDKDLNDLFIIKNNTLFAFGFQLNFNAVMETPFKDSACAKKLDKISRRYLQMPLAESADLLTGSYAGILNVNKITEGENAGRKYLEFMFIIPDVEKKLFKKLGEHLVVNRKAVYKDKMLHVRTKSLFKEMVVLSDDKFMLIVSSPEFVVNVFETMKKKETGSLMKKLEVPLLADDETYIFVNREFSAFANSLFHNKNYALKFMEDFAGNDVFNIIKSDDDEIEIEQYSTAPFSQMMLMPFSLNMMVHCDALIFRSGRKKYIADKIASENRNCFKNMQIYAQKLKEYRKKYGEYPTGINAEGLKKFADFAKIPPDKFAVKLHNKKLLPFSGYYYWGENNTSTRHDIPLLCGRTNVHGKKIHIIFCDGSVREFELENIRSAKRIVSFLYTVFKYDNATFRTLLQQAERLDSEKL